MARISYDEAAVAAFAADRHLDRDGLAGWREAVTRHLRPRPGSRVLDLGSGTGMWSAAVTDWCGVHVVAVEPSAAMRARSAYRPVLGGDARAIPVADHHLDGAWLSTVIHHIPDLPAAAAELRRVLRAGAPLLIRNVFPGRHAGVTLFRYFPQAVRVLDTYPSVSRLVEVFAAAGLEYVALESVPQVTADSLATAARRLRRAAHTPLRLITDEEYAAGLSRLRRAAETAPGPVVDTLDLLVLR